ncbi:MAG: ThiF family adenylyltransferase [Clostridiales bacterium]|nr:ThiF family adenylyltransferase [Clostridiales bacterium]
MKGKGLKPTVCYPLNIEGNHELWGYHHSESNYYNIVSIDTPDTRLGGEAQILLGHFYDTKPEQTEVMLYGWKDTDGNVQFQTSDGKQCQLEGYSLQIDIFSRNTGILESDIMLKKGVVIIGCGSVGSFVALELARAGVGRFFLIDMDILSYHNICRHQCGILDVGKYKTTALRERILQINPKAEVHVSHKRIQDVPLAEIEPFCTPDAIVVGCADNREGDYYAAQLLAKPNGMPFISIGCWERAFAGEIFYCLSTGMPDYEDFLATMTETSGRVEANTHIYMGEVGSFEPGISADINFVTTIGVKMILDLLNRDNENYTQRLIDSLTQYTLICNTNNPKIGGEMAEIFSYPLQVTRSIVLDYAEKEEPKEEPKE